MRYEGNVFRPPSEAGSLILQVTIGCSHNQCTFCRMYKGEKYREREWDEIKEDIDFCAERLKRTKRIFLADGDALAMRTENLLKVLNYLFDSFPMLERVGTYANPGSILEKDLTELIRLREAGLKIAYLGVETGNEEMLKEIRKGVTRAEMIEAGLKLKKAGIILSVTIINGLGGNEKMVEHARDTATILNEIDPDYLSFLTLMLPPGSPLYRKAQRNEFKIPEAMEILKEIELMLKPLNLSNCVFRSNHASNYLPLGGTLPRDKEKILEVLGAVLKSGDMRYLRPEYLRGL
jgi:radical SAM superfamily enzyme YgiQ (UPF0313 family)